MVLGVSKSRLIRMESSVCTLKELAKYSAIGRQDKNWANMNSRYTDMQIPTI